MFTPAISVLIVTFNSSLEKTLVTIRSILNQNNVSFDLVLSDDGSEVDNFEEIKHYLKSVGFSHYTLLRNVRNEGTVSNIAKGLEACRGKYVKTISPGDALFDEDSLSRIVSFMDMNSCQIGFGDAVYYCKEEAAIRVFNIQNPHCPEVFPCEVGDSYKSSRVQKHLIVYKDGILGAATFFDTSYLRRMLASAQGNVKYLEDKATTICAAIEGTPIFHLPATIVWYEYRSGVSTARDSKWVKVLRDDERALVHYLYRVHGDNKYVRWLERRERLFDKLGVAYSRTRFFFTPLATLHMIYASRRKTNVPINETELAAFRGLMNNA